MSTKKKLPKLEPLGTILQMLGEDPSQLRADAVRAGLAMGFQLAATAARARSLDSFAAELEVSALQLLAPLLEGLEKS